MRIALYSHDTMGLGHMRRNLLIAQSLTEQFPAATVLMIAGAKEINTFRVPDGVDCLTLPSLRKDLEGGYQSRSLRVDLPHLIGIRSSAIRAAMEVFAPDLLIVDKVPRGVQDELIDTLKAIRHGDHPTRCVLGFRDILDDKQSTLRDWESGRTLDVIRDYFDAVWVYGDRRVFDLVDEYDLPEDIAEKVEFTGYFDQRQREAFSEKAPSWTADLPADPFNLCMVGGGQDGEPLARAFCQAVRHTPDPAVLVTGPYMPADARRALQRRALGIDNLSVLEFVPEADWLIHRASQVVCMGGYNTATSVLSFQKRALVMPRVTPRLEQLVRCRRFSDLGWMDMVHPADLEPDLIRGWLESRNLWSGDWLGQVNLSGLPTIHGLIRELLPSQRSASSSL